MDSVNRLEVYIPVEAEVKNVPLWSLPTKVLRKMGLPPADFQGSKKLSSSPEGVWICPAVVRRKGQKQASPSGQGLVARESSLLGSQVRTTPGPLRMSFVSSNKAAYRVLRQIPGANVAALPQGSAPQTYGTAVFVYCGRIYLSIRKQALSLSDSSSPPFTSSSSSSSSSSSKRPRKQLQNENGLEKKKRTPCAESKKDAACEASSAASARPVLQQQQQEMPAALKDPDWLEPAGGSSDGGECQTQDVDGGGDAESSSSSSQSGARTEPPPSAACGSPSLAKEYDDLAQEERIARMKARLRQNEAMLNNLHSAL